MASNNPPWTDRTSNPVAVRRISAHLLGEDVVNIWEAIESFPNGYTVVPKEEVTRRVRAEGILVTLYRSKVFFQLSHGMQDRVREVVRKVEEDIRERNARR